MEPVVMEQISMYLVGLPCPPIPITLNISSFAKREETDDDDNGDGKDRRVCSSHDMLAGLIVSAMRRNNQALNEVRMKKQMEITKTFLDQIEKLEESDVGGMYSACQVFTAYYILSFDDIPGRSMQFSLLEDVSKEDKVFEDCCSWNAAQDILYESDETKRRTTEQYKLCDSFVDLVKVHCKRVKASLSKPPPCMSLASKKTVDSS